MSKTANIKTLCDTKTLRDIKWKLTYTTFYSKFNLANMKHKTITSGISIT